MLGLEIYWGFVVQGLMDSFGVVEGFDVAERAELRLLDVSERLMVSPLLFQGPEETFRYHVIITASGATHRAGNIEGS